MSYLEQQVALGEACGVHAVPILPIQPRNLYTAAAVHHDGCTWWQNREDWISSGNILIKVRGFKNYRGMHCSIQPYLFVCACSSTTHFTKLGGDWLVKGQLQLNYGLTNTFPKIPHQNIEKTLLYWSFFFFFFGDDYMSSYGVNDRMMMS